ncbi:MAG: glutaredoxin family protein [Actinobacteria bacterium]|nr:glutaredoxin family protein [Actinomycetota bacterium]
MERSITFVTRQDCEICDAALPGVQAWAERLGLHLAVADVDATPGLRDRFDRRVPVVLSDGGEVLLEGRWGAVREARMMLRARYG